MFNLDISIYQGPRDGDGNENFEKAIGLDQRNNNSAQHALLYISLPSLHDYDVKIPNFMLEELNKGRRIFLCLFKLELGLPKKSTQRKYAYIWLFRWKRIKATKFEKTRTHFKSDVFPAVAVVDAKACVQTSPLPQENRFFSEGVGDVCTQATMLNEKLTTSRLPLPSAPPHPCLVSFVFSVCIWLISFAKFPALRQTKNDAVSSKSIYSIGGMHVLNPDEVSIGTRRSKRELTPIPNNK